MAVGTRLRRGGEAPSQLPRVLLQLNPGIARQTEQHLVLLDALKAKADRSCDSRRRMVASAFEASRIRRENNYNRSMRMDEETKKAVDRYREGSKAFIGSSQAFAATVMDQSQGSRRRRRPSSCDHLRPEDAATAIRDVWNTPNSGYESSDMQWGESAAGSEIGVANRSGFGAPGAKPAGRSGAVASSAVSSRRSSLRSASYLELEGIMGRGDSPDPPPTEDPLEGLGAALSRKSSVSSLMPEVVVTQVARRSTSPAASSDKTPSLVQEDTDKLKAPASASQRIWNLLPAPTPTRFVGRMHAVVSGPEKRRIRSDSFSRKSSLVSETIKEDEASPDAEDQAHYDFPKSAPITPTSKQEFVFDATSEEVIRKSEVRRKFSFADLAPGIPTTTRFVGRMRGAIRSMHRYSDTSEEDADEAAGTTRMSPANSRRGSWRSQASSSQSGEGKRLLRRTSSTSVSNAMASRRTATGRKRSSGRKASEGQAKAATRSVALHPQIKRVVHKGLRFYQKNSKEILEAVGVEGFAEDHEEDEDKSLLPGMKRRFFLKRVASFSPSECEEEEEANQVWSDHSSGLEESGGDVADAASESAERRSGVGALGSASVGAEVSIADMVKGIPTTSKLVSKLHSLRAHLDEAGSSSDADDKWDWMTGVPTSVRFLAKSWRGVARGPGGIVTENPGAKRTAAPDFSGTVNMLTMLAKADLKLKCQAKEDDESLSSERGASTRRRRSTAAAVGVVGRLSPSAANQMQGASSKSPLAVGPRSASKASNVEAEQSESSEKEQVLRKLLDSMVLVDQPTIPKWNIDKSVKEEKGGEPFLLAPEVELI